MGHRSTLWRWMQLSSPGTRVPQPPDYWQFGLADYCRGCPMHCRIFSSNPGLYLLDASSTPLFQLWQPKMSLDVVACPLGATSLLVENQMGVVGSLYQPLKRSIRSKHLFCFCALQTLYWGGIITERVRPDSLGHHQIMPFISWWRWSSFLTPPCLSFLVSKTGRRIVSTLQDCSGD